MSDSESTSEIQARVAQTRAQLEDTLDAIEDKLNVPKQFAQLVKRAQDAYDENPTPWLAAAAGTVAVVGGIIVWAAVSRD